MTLSLAATSWCENHPTAVHPDFISQVILRLAKMKVKPIELIHFFDRQFADQIALFSDEVSLLSDDDNKFNNNNNKFNNNNNNNINRKSITTIINNDCFVG